MASAAARRRDEAPAAPPVLGTKKGGATVTVACKIETGLELQLCRQQDVPEEDRRGGGVSIVLRKQSVKHGPVYVVRGPGYPNGPIPKGFPRRASVVGGYALTPGVPADFWEEWLEQNKDAPYVVNRMIFAHSRQDDARAEARELRETRSGLEPIDPEGDPRAPRPLIGSIKPVETEETWAARSHLPEEAAEED